MTTFLFLHQIGDQNICVEKTHFFRSPTWYSFEHNHHDWCVALTQNLLIIWVWLLKFFFILLSSPDCILTAFNYCFTLHTQGANLDIGFENQISIKILHSYICSWPNWCIKQVPVQYYLTWFKKKKDVIETVNFVDFISLQYIDLYRTLTQLKRQSYEPKTQEDTSQRDCY